MQNKAFCPVVTDYQDYERHPNAEYCYLMYSSQYYWQPWQLEKLSKEGQHFWGYKKSELYTTYKNALGGFFRRVKVPEME